MAMSDDKNNQPQRSYVSRSQIMSVSPSRQHGIDFQREERLRRRYVRFIRELGITLRLPQHPTIATATVLCHRFFMQQSHSLNDSLLIASACLFLATKSEDSPCTLSRIVAAYRRLCGSYVPPTPSPATTSHALPSPRQELLHAEFLVLTTIAFDLIVDHPYKPLLFAINKLKQNPQMKKELFMLGQRNAQKGLEGTHASLNKFGTAERRDYRFMAKHVGNAPSDSLNGQVLSNGTQHQSPDRHSFEYVGGQAYVHSTTNTEPHPTTLERIATTANGLDHQNQQRPHQERKFKPSVDFQNAGEKALLQVAWNFVNDSLLTLLSLQFKPHVIAAATLWLAAKFLDVKLPSQGERTWWRELDVTPCQLEEVGNQIVEVCIAVETDTKTSE
ncbi:hypothetical protein L7F22_003402 [Adiantum nelumboides]|nr:hypothetical protein [Adiantum nelumboides]